MVTPISGLRIVLTLDSKFCTRAINDVVNISIPVFLCVYYLFATNFLSGARRYRTSRPSSSGLKL